MKPYFLMLFIALLIFSHFTTMAQNQYSVPNCNFPKSQKFVGDRLRLPLPKGAIVKRGRDIDYSDYYIWFGKKKNQVYLSGIFGPTATSGQVSNHWLSSSSDITQRIWKSSEDEGIDAKGKLKNGNYWRYFGRFGESINYYDVPAEATTYFDSIIDNLCYQK